MRLIDADKIPTVSWDKIEEEAFRQTIAEQPTVDAIPVNWIEQYGEENWFDYGTQYNAITEMLKAWERENE